MYCAAYHFFYNLGSQIVAIVFATFYDLVYCLENGMENSR